MTAEQPQVSPGLHPGMSNDAYHAEAEHLSSTRLKKALPEHYRPAPTDSAALVFGSLVHEVVLEPETLARYVPLDAATIGVKADGTPAQVPTMTGAWKRAVAEVEQDGRTVVDVASWDKAHRMADAIAAHPEARSLLLAGEGRNELSMFAQDRGVGVKCRWDRLLPGVGVDLKTTAANPGARSLERTVVAYGYDVSAAHYLAVAGLCGVPVDDFVLVFVGKSEPHHVTVAPLSEDFIERGRALREIALDRIAGRVEPYEGATGRITLYPPLWSLDATEPEMEII